ncbi:hypothetical protein GCM10011390_45990 [Aureimonas endophytica]|uniref:Blue-light-activated histidine kinase n=1 Tax=Aureimonas endophytica TaxID=2027858 RepID=A0A917A0P9_9HYPH|nr:PAS domain S-box protein [Aureimonas endophytica]GGE21466.1 hypothetical protein GCM10011390_45990 [Aureimonas endophytica]
MTGDHPSAEAARLATLASYGVLDTPPEPGFDDIVALARQVCAAPVALVSLVDRDRQWFKARVGFEPAQTDLDRSVCRHALGRTDILEIGDLTRDPRTAANPLVTGEPFLRFYAGMPLNARDGRTLGTLCVLDHRPRPEGLDEAQRTGLAALAAQVMAQLDLRRALEALEADRRAARAEAARLDAMIATQQAVAGAETDLDTVFRAIADGALGAIGAADGAAIELREGEDLVFVAASGALAPHRGLHLPIGRSLSGRALLEGRPIACADTAADPAVDPALSESFGIRSLVVVPVTRRGVPIGVLKVCSGRPQAFAARDVAMARMLASLVASACGDAAEAVSHRALRDAEARYRQTFESVTEFAVIVTDPAGRITEWNMGAERIFGWTAADMRGGDASRFFTPEDRAGDRAGTEMSRSLVDGQATDERWHMREDGSRFYASGNMMPLRGESGEHLGFIKIVRDRTEQHLAGRQLEDLEKRLQQAQEAVGVGLFTVEVATGLLTATPQFSRLFGYDHQEVRPAEDFEALVVAEDQELVSNNSTRRDGGAPRDVEYRIRRADTGEIRWIARKGEFTHDAAGRPLRFAGIARDITSQVLDRKALNDEREQLAAIFAQAPSFMALLRGPEHRFERVNPSYTKIVGGRDLIGRTVAQALPDAAAQGFVDILDEVYRTGVAYHATNVRYGVQVSPEGPVVPRHLDFVYQPIRDGEGTVTGIFVEGVDITERILAARRLRQTEDRYRALVENVDVGICIVEMKFDADGQAIDYRIMEGNEAYERHTGLYGTIGKWVSEFAPLLERHWFDLYGHVALTGEPLRFENGAESLGGRWFEVQAHRVGASEERQVAILFTDITARKQQEDQRAILSAELAHRLKNTLALVSAIVMQTLRTATDIPTARKVLMDRILTLSKAHDILLTGRRDAASIGEIVRTSTSLHEEGGRIEVEGPAIALGPKAAMTLSLVCHELSTNAAKYGALSLPEGRVLVGWSVLEEGEGGEPMLVIEWRETGGPPVAPPERRSFGTRLIEIGLSTAPGSAAVLDYDPAGLRCRIVAPLCELQEQAPEA